MASTQPRLSISTLFSFIIIITFRLCAALFPTQLIYEFPNGTFVENLAVRPDGSIITTLATSPELYLVQPLSAKPNPQLIHRFDGSTSVTGITETSPDSFQVATTSVSGPGQAVPGSSSLWRVTFPRRNADKVEVSLTATLPDVLAPNGLITLNEDRILLADSAKGIIFAIDINTGTSNIAVTDPLLAHNERIGVGVNGVKICGRTLYFTNTAQILLGQVDIDLKTGAARGPASKIVNTLPPAFAYDDFALNDKGEAFVTNVAGNFIERVDLKSRQQTIIAGSINSTDIAEPTSAAFGRNGREDVLYVSTAGGLLIPVNGNEIVGGQVVAVKLGKRW